MLLAKMGQKYVTYITYKNAKKDTRMAQCRHTGIYERGLSPADRAAYYRRLSAVCAKVYL